ncbi:transposase [Legionella pneumophila serogroup 5]|nr:transposase [Legionella pneumophila subsp. fraseri]MDW9035743.1 transposase [Legionella pneumophila subsp. fraseri]MDW9039244.1 transposase [Legionella pneumophila subsp. fraseri]MDW9042092.1 transposase [Legionella pneumophila subsp. fraseri]MDW9064029.1 transposase [Legionella pneumophila subsp. fraseri]
MVRPLRIEFAGGLYHITSRGNRKEAIYLSDEDRENFLSVLSDACLKYQWLCHSYCLMTNHYHLLIETPLGNLSTSKGSDLALCLYP